MKRCDWCHHGIDGLVERSAGFRHVLKSDFQKKVLSVPLVHPLKKYFLNVYFVSDIHRSTKVRKKTVCFSSGPSILMGLGKTVNTPLNSLSRWTNSAVKLK